MPRFSDGTLEQVRAIGIEKIVEQYVELKQKSGTRDLWGLCPFHNENSPSFKVDLERGFYKCFGCDAKGDGISFIMRRLGFVYIDAVAFIAEKFGIDIEFDGEDNKNRKDIQELHNDIQIMLRKSLYSSLGQEALNYIKSRSFNDDDLNEFGIGFIEPRADFSEIFKKYSQDILLSSGFFKESNFRNPSTRFFNRLTLPIRNITGTIAAFAGRSLDSSAPKYLNSAESELFHKRDTLFNIDKAKLHIKNSNSCFVVEGYFDVMRLHKLGYKNVIAPMGTALTAGQVSMLRRYANEVTVVFDGDEAGEKAAYRSLSVFVETSVFPKVIFLPENDDPDSFALREGKAGLDKIFANKDDLFLNVSKRLAKSAGDDFNKKLIRFQSVKKMLASVNDPHLSDYYAEAVADIFGLKKDNITQDVAISRYQRSQNSKTSADKSNAKKNIYPCEMDFIAALCLLPIDVVDGLINDMSSEMFKDLSIGNIFKKILEVYGSIADIKELVPELGGEFVDIISRDIAGDPYKVALGNKKQIVVNHLKQKQQTIIEQLRKTESTDEKISLLKELDELTRKLAQNPARQGDI